LHLEVIRDPERLLQFAPEWSAFARSQPNVTPFQLPEWLLTWWSHFGSGSPRVFVFRERECVGVLPCFLHQWEGKRQLTLMGSGISDYLDPIFVASEEPAILSCLRQELAATEDWEVCNWQDLAYDTPLASLGEERWTLQRQEEVVCRVIEFEGAFEQYWEERPHHLQRSVRYGDKALRDGSLEFHVTCCAEESSLQALIRLHSARWRAHGEPGTIAINHSEKLLSDIARRFAQENMLRIFSVCYQGQVAAMILGFVYQQVVHGYLTGFDPAYKQRSLASVLLRESVKDCWRQGVRAWNFGRGDEAYKSEWGAQAMRRCRLVLYPKRS
jgi:CelD/BcsL family acetyltransferase involved in cellulose biosynthesis